MAVFMMLVAGLLIAGIIACIKNPVKKQGLLEVGASILLCDIACIIMLINNQMGTVKVSFLLYYLAHAWFFFFAALIVFHMSFDERLKFYKMPVFYISLAQTGIVAMQAFTDNSFTVKKHIFVGNNWWIATGKEFLLPEGLIDIYMILGLLSVLVMLIELARGLKKTTDIYKPRLYAIAFVLILYVAVETVIKIGVLPVFLVSFFMSIMYGLTIFYALYYPDKKLKSVSLMAFADDLSAGMILYNASEKLIYVNGFLRHILEPEVIESFKNIEQTREWASKLSNHYGVEAKKIIVNDKPYYFTIDENELGDGKVKTGILFGMEDITNSVLQIIAMEKVNEELEATAKMKSDFLANMSHELRTPMNAVIGMAELTLREQLSPQATDYIRQIKNSGQNLLNIINDILDFSKIESGKMDIIPAVYEPTSLLQDVTNTLAVRAEGKNIELLAQMLPDIPARLKGDSVRIRQILINLANNAIKFTKEGRVLLLMGYEKLDDNTVSLVIHCEDTGSGIKEDDLKKLFVSFQQVDSKRNRNVEGTGLGLAISKNLVEAMNGNIGVDSQYGRGSDFYFNIPQEIVDETPSIGIDDAENKSILGVFTNTTLRGSFLETAGFLGVEASVVSDLRNYNGTATHILVDEVLYDAFAEEYFTGHPEINGIVLTGFSSEFKSTVKNVRVMRRPFTSLMLAKALNNQEFVIESDQDQESFGFDFIAPSARVLIVDDNSVNLVVASGLIEPLKMQVDTATSGVDAIKHCKAEKYDIVFMDHMMPEMDGVETTAKLRSEVENAKDIPIIALSANAVNGAREMFIENGMNDFVSKPIELKAIVQMIKKWLPEEKLEMTEVRAVAPEEKTEELIIEGLDVTSAVALIGSAPLYVKILKDYYGSIDKHYDEIEAAYAAKAVEDYTIKVHALKSSSRQVGAMELGMMAEKLEKAGHDADMEYIDDHHAEALAEYRRVQGLIKVYMDAQMPEETAELKEFDAGELRAQLDKLKMACDELDMDTMEEVSEALGSMKFEGELKDTIEKIVEATGMMDTETVEELIDSMVF